MYIAAIIFPSVSFDVPRIIKCLKLSRKFPLKLGEENPNTKKMEQSLITDGVEFTC